MRLPHARCMDNRDAVADGELAGSPAGSDGVDEQADQSFPASDPPSWSGLSLYATVDPTPDEVRERAKH